VLDLKITIIPSGISIDVRFLFDGGNSIAGAAGPNNSQIE
jgi:hypothetical protein